jgi:hypothetical protein
MAFSGQTAPHCPQLAGSISNAAPPQTPDEAPFPAEDAADPRPGEPVTSALAPVFVWFEEVHPAVSIRAMITAHRTTGNGRFIGHSFHRVLEIIMISIYFSGPIEPELPHPGSRSVPDILQESPL